MVSMKPGAKTTTSRGGKNTPPANQLPPFAKGGVKVAAPRTGNGRKSL